MHHTKDKADIGLSKVISDLAVKGHVACIPLSEHQPYDLVIVTKDGRSMKLQVKYAALKRNGTIEIKTRRTWADSKGNYSKKYKLNEFDYYAVYCPEKDKVLYVPNCESCPISIRFDKPANNQTANVHWADSYCNIR